MEIGFGSIFSEILLVPKNQLCRVFSNNIQDDILFRNYSFILFLKNQHLIFFLVCNNIFHWTTCNKVQDKIQYITSFPVCMVLKSWLMISLDQLRSDNSRSCSRWLNYWNDNDSFQNYSRHQYQINTNSIIDIWLIPISHNSIKDY